jgi:hypothetical protein
MLENLRQKNEDIFIFEISDSEFQKYGRVLEGYNIKEITEYMKHKTEIPAEGNIYIPSDTEMEKLEIIKKIKKNIFGGLEVQAGYCNGNNTELNALEFHKSPEINIAVTDMMLILGKTGDIKENEYNIGKTEIFYIPQGTIFEVYGDTLHFSPCSADDRGFKCVVVLLRGTNTELSEKAEDKLLFKKNKWIIIHKDFTRLADLGAHKGLKGSNIKIKY